MFEKQAEPEMAAKSLLNRLLKSGTAHSLVAELLNVPVGGKTITIHYNGESASVRATSPSDYQHHCVPVAVVSVVSGSNSKGLP